jgi:hypothetical protein
LHIPFSIKHLLKHKHMTENRQTYEAPAMEIIPTEPGCVMAGSPLSGNTGTTHSEGGATFTRSPYGNASSSDLDAMINDILTVEP